MDEFAGIEKVNPKEREEQHLLNKALWKKLQNEGFSEAHAGRVTGFFCSEQIEQAGLIIKEYDAIPGWDTDVLKSDDDLMFYSEVTCSLSHFSVQLFNDLSDMFMISAKDATSKFEGLEVDINTVINLKKPWWKFW